MISVRQLHKSYPTRFGQKTVLDGVSFDLRKGERLGVLGRNGAGKSTLIRLVSGAERPSSGLVERTMSVSWPLAFGGAFQPQLTGIDNIRFITRVYGQDFERNLAFVEDFAELGPYLREPVRTYSSGMRARLAFAISMIIEFDCFLIDEIGAVGDARFHDRCNHELFSKRADRAMMIISHDAGYVREHCNRWAILHDGRLMPFAQFDDAYASYKELIGAQAGEVPAPVIYASRARMIDSSQHAALADEIFRAHVQQGDWARDERNWSKAREHYTQALVLYPYQRSYWVQLGHMNKELSDFVAAEAAYRTAIALGEPKADVEDHLRYVYAQQGAIPQDMRYTTPKPGGTAEQPPTLPDFSLLAKLFRPDLLEDDAAALLAMRNHATLGSLASAMVMERPAQDKGAAQIACEQAIQPDPIAALFGLNTLEAGDLASLVVEGGSMRVRDWFANHDSVLAGWPALRAALNDNSAHAPAQTDPI